jgi:hypothetical protein
MSRYPVARVLTGCAQALVAVAAAFAAVAGVMLTAQGEVLDGVRTVLVALSSGGLAYALLAAVLAIFDIADRSAESLELSAAQSKTLRQLLTEARTPATGRPGAAGEWIADGAGVADVAAADLERFKRAATKP